MSNCCRACIFLVSIVLEKRVYKYEGHIFVNLWTTVLSFLLFLPINVIYESKGVFARIKEMYVMYNGF